MPQIKNQNVNQKGYYYFHCSYFLNIFINIFIYNRSSSIESVPLVFQLEYRLVSGLTSQWREFLALHEAYRSPLLPTILNPLYGTNGSQIMTPIIVKNDDRSNDYDNSKKSAPSTPPSHIPKALEVPESEVALDELGSEYDITEKESIQIGRHSPTLPPPPLTSSSLSSSS